MNLTKQNIVSFEMVLQEGPLAKNFSKIQDEFKKLKGQIKGLKENSLMIIDRINQIDPLQAFEFMEATQNQDQQQIESASKPNCVVENSYSGENENSGSWKVDSRINISKNLLKQEMSQIQAQQTQQSRRRSSLSTNKNRLNESALREIIQQIQGRLKLLEETDLEQGQKLFEIQKQNNSIKKMLGMKETKTKQRKTIDENQKRISIDQSRANQLIEKSQVQLSENKIEDENIQQHNFVSQFNKELTNLKDYMVVKFTYANNNIEKCFNCIQQVKIEVKDIKEDSYNVRNQVEALDKELKQISKNSAAICQPFLYGQNNQEKQDRLNFMRTKTSINNQQRGSTSFQKNTNSDKTMLNDTIESYKNYYEDKIVQIFQEMDRMKGEYLQVIEKLQGEEDCVVNSEDKKSIGRKIISTMTPTEERLNRELSLMKRELKKFQDQYGRFMLDLNTGTGENRTLVIKANENKEDWKDVTQKIHKLRQELLSYVKDLQGKIIANNDLTVVIQELEVGLNECKIINGKKLSIMDYQKSNKRLESRLNNFIHHFYEKQGISMENQGLLVKQPWFCLSCDSELKNFTGKVGKPVLTQKPTGKKVNPESHMVRRPETKLPSVH